MFLKGYSEKQLKLICNEEKGIFSNLTQIQESVFVDLLFNVLPIVCGSSVFVFVLLSVTLCPF